MATKSSDLFMRRKHRIPSPPTPRPKYGMGNLSSHFRPIEPLDTLKSENPGARLEVKPLEETLPYVNKSIKTDETPE